MIDSYKRIELFVQRYMGQHWNQFMKKLAEMNPTLKELQNLVTTTGVLFIKAGILKIHYMFTVPTTRFHPSPKPYTQEGPATPLTTANTSPVNHPPVKISLQPPSLETPAAATRTKSSIEMELDPNPDGFPKSNQPHILSSA